MGLFLLPEFTTSVAKSNTWHAFPLATGDEPIGSAIRPFQVIKVDPFASVICTHMGLTQGCMQDYDIA